MHTGLKLWKLWGGGISEISRCINRVPVKAGGREGKGRHQNLMEIPYLYEKIDHTLVDDRRDLSNFTV